MTLIRLRRRSLFRLFSTFYPVILLVCLIWGESLNYYHSRMFWNVAESELNEGRSLGILIVADPQLVGFRNENHMMGPLTRWDCDRFLSKGFSHAVSATNPDLIIFLGDLFDEGVEASDTEIDWTVDRFKAIFDSKIPTIYISGDNDVGGEVEPVQSLLTARFGRIFANSFPSSKDIFKSISFTGVNLMNSEVTTIQEFSEPPELKVVLSHVPFATATYIDTLRITSELNPDLILSAHDHKAGVHHISRDSTNAKSKDLTGIRQIQEFILDPKEILELQTPTCSYRMGVYDVGYGFVRIDRSVGDDSTNRYRVAFSILWIHSRFYALMLYVFIVTIGLLILLFEMGFVLFSRRHRSLCLPKYRSTN
ncbi:hypothetical protein V3C99_009647 [Haemonchus contortus]